MKRSRVVPTRFSCGSPAKHYADAARVMRRGNRRAVLVGITEMKCERCGIAHEAPVFKADPLDSGPVVQDKAGRCYRVTHRGIRRMIPKHSEARP